MVKTWKDLLSGKDQDKGTQSHHSYATQYWKS